MQPLVLTVVREFLGSERLKLRRWLIDRLRCELDLGDDEAGIAIAALESAGVVRMVEISHYDPALEDVSCELAVVAGPACDEAFATAG